MLEALSDRAGQVQRAASRGVDFRALNWQDIRHLSADDKDWMYVPLIGQFNGYQLVLVADVPSDHAASVKLYLQESTLRISEPYRLDHLAYYSIDLSVNLLGTNPPLQQCRKVERRRRKRR